MENVNPQLDSHSVLAHFANSTKNVQLMNFLLSLDRVDRWAVDYDEFNSPQRLEIEEFLRDMQEFVTTFISVLHRVPREFSELLAYLTTSRCLYLIRYAALNNPDFLERFMFILEDATEPNAISVMAVRRRLEAFSKAKLLGDIFSGSRLSRIVNIMGSYKNV